MKTKHKIWISCTIVIILLLYWLPGKITYEKFDSAKWKNWKETEVEWSLRWDMMNSLRNQYDLEGMDKKEILQLLGTPDSKTNNEFNYNLGAAKRGIDQGALRIVFNDKEKVLRFYTFIH